MRAEARERASGGHRKDKQEPHRSRRQAAGVGGPSTHTMVSSAVGGIAVKKGFQEWHDVRSSPGLTGKAEGCGGGMEGEAGGVGHEAQAWVALLAEVNLVWRSIAQLTALCGLGRAGLGWQRC